MSFKFYAQLDSMDCGPTCLRMVAKHYGKNFTLQHLRKNSSIGREGVSLLGISRAAEAIGFKTVGVRISLDQLEEENIFPVIIHWHQEHFVVIYKVRKNKVYIADPGRGLLVYSKREITEAWATQDGKGIALLLEPTPQFYAEKGEKDEGIKLGILLKYLSSYKALLLQLLLGLTAGTILQLIFPFLTQSIVDVGIQTKDIGFIYMILLGQLMLFLGQTFVEFIRSWVLLHINTRINVTILSDFLIKLMKLPISFFDTKLLGDVMQRMDDQQRIQQFLTGPALNSVFSVFNFLIFTFIIGVYSPKILLVFLAGSVLYFCWVLFFLKYRRTLDQTRFEIAAKNQSKVIQLVSGMQEIKMNNCEIQKRWEWERLQARLFKVSVKGLSLTQYQQGGAFFINQTKNILITFLSAMGVVHGTITLGEMLAIQYIIGQLNGPIEQFIQLLQSSQDAMISLERLNEIHQMEDEEEEIVNTEDVASLLYHLPSQKDISIKNLSFKYPEAGNAMVLKDINLHIPEGKTTAIVGISGSGKTTLLKLLMKFYPSSTGTITLGDHNINRISVKTWRDHCGAVLQDSYIFSDTIANNIAISDEVPDMEKLLYALKIANITEFIESLPLGLNTRIGSEGVGISMGQKQRILIARAVYKNPEFIFFDEATNSLDANNERIIMENLEEYFKGKTVIVVAHRLSTVRNADQIIVLDNGEIIEQGSHHQLTVKKGMYYTLVKNQLELGN